MEPGETSAAEDGAVEELVEVEAVVVVDDDDDDDDDDGGGGGDDDDDDGGGGLRSGWCVIAAL